MANISTIFILPTQDNIAQSYRDYITAQNSSINPNIPESDYYFKSVALAGINTGAVADASYYFVNMFPQYLSGVFVDLALAAKGLLPRQAATYATAVLGTGAAPTASFTVQAGMQLNDQVTNTIFQIINTTTISTSDPQSYNNIPSICTISGSGNQVPVATVLTFANPPIDINNNPVLSLIVQSSTDGTNLENDNEAVQRILAGTQIPRSGSRITDYYEYAIGGNKYLPAIIITDAIPLPNNKFLSGNFNFGVFGVGGSPINDYTLNQSILYNISAPYLPFTRTLDNTAISAIEQSIDVQEMININPYINTVSTQELPTTQSSIVTPYIQATVTLYTGYTLSTVLQINSTDQNGNPIIISITIENLIKREIRRAICQQPYGAQQTLAANGSIVSSIIPLSVIEQQLDEALGTGQYNGIYATVLLNRQIFIYNPAISDYAYINIPLSIGIPNPPANPIVDYPLAWIYDITSDPSIGYGNIIVQLSS